MVNKRRRPGNRRHKVAKTRRPISSQQNARLQQAVLADSRGQLEVAESAYRALIAENISSPDVYCGLARICVQSARRDEANVLWRKALALDSKSIEAQMNLADSFRLDGKLERACEIYRQVLSDHEDFHVAKYLLANILKSQGKLSEATQYYQQVMAQKPDYTQAHFTYSGVHRYKSRSDPHIDSMLEMYRKPDLSTASKIHLAFALAKVFEDLGGYSQAFDYLKTGNALRSKEFHYDIESDQSLIDSIIRTFSADAISRFMVDGQHSSRPIFIIGMPRSGTSLVEKIIASHSEVYGAGELDFMFALGTSNFLNKENNFEYQPLASYPPDTFDTVGNTYLEKISALNNHARRVTDKMPFNMMMVGLIKIALPNAKIVHCVRDARDTCLSIFKQNFSTGNYRFAYDQKTVAQFHNQYRKLMKHWHEAIPGSIYDVCYERLVENPEQEISKMLTACDLDFQEDCLAFSGTEAVVTTASASQVRRPMYTSSVGLWEKYQQYLGPMLDELQEA